MSKFRMVAAAVMALVVISAQSAWAGSSSSSSSRSTSVSSYSARPSFSASSSSSGPGRTSSYSARPSFSASSASSSSGTRPSYAPSRSPSATIVANKASAGSTRMATQPAKSRSSDGASYAGVAAKSSISRTGTSSRIDRTAASRTTATLSAGRINYSQYSPKFQSQLRSQESGFRNRMQTEYAATTRTKSSSSIWGLLFLAWMLSDNAHKSDADMRALHAEVASLRQSMTAEELRYAQDISVQEGWYLPEDSLTEPSEGDVTVQAFADVQSQAVAQEGSSRPIERLAGPVHELLGTDDPVEAVFKMAGYMAPLMFLFFLATVMRNVFRG